MRLGNKAEKYRKRRDRELAKSNKTWITIIAVLIVLSILSTCGNDSRKYKRPTPTPEIVETIIFDN